MTVRIVPALAVVLALAAGCATAPKKLHGDWPLQANVWWGTSVRTPPDWNGHLVRGTGGDYLITHPEGPWKGRCVVTSRSAPGTLGLSVKQLKSWSTPKQLKESFISTIGAESVVTRVEDGMLDTKPAFLTFFTRPGTQGQPGTKGRLLLTYRHGTRHLIDCRARAEYFDAVEPVFGEIGKTFRFSR